MLTHSLPMRMSSRIKETKEGAGNPRALRQQLFWLHYEIFRPRRGAQLGNGKAKKVPWAIAHGSKLLLSRGYIYIYDIYVLIVYVCIYIYI